MLPCGCERETPGDSLCDQDGRAPLSIFLPLPMEEAVNQYQICSACASAFVAAFIENKTVRRGPTIGRCCLFYARSNEGAFTIDVIDPGVDDEWSVILSNRDLALLGTHAEAGRDLSARDLLAWRRRFPYSPRVSADHPKNVLE
jgi:hypothetical protein